MQVIQIDDVERVKGLEHRSSTFFARSMAKGEGCWKGQ
jgi:hypothetical protein